MKRFSLCLALLFALVGSVAQAANLTATKTVSGSFFSSGTVTYTIVITNGSATGAQADNPGDEFADSINFPLFLQSTSTTSGTVSSGNPVTWNGAIPANGSVTITINARFFAAAGQTVSNQGTVNFDADNDGSNEASTLTDDPNTVAANDATVFTVIDLADTSGFSAPSTRPASTLLLPYFEVDPISNFPNLLTGPAAAPLNTLVTVSNTDATAVLARVTVWTDYGIPTLSFHLYFTGFDTETLDLRELFDGVLPRSADDGEDPLDNISQQGLLSQDINYLSCTAVNNGVRLPAADIIGLRDAHVGLASSLLGNLCGARNHGDGILRGYITIDAVNACDDTLLPNDAGYEALLTAQNQLSGSWSIVSGTDNSADSGSLTHILSDASLPANTITFYRRFNGDNSKLALGNIWGTRYGTGGVFDAGTALKVWREPRSTPAPVACANTAPAFLPGDQAIIVAFDEEENPVELVPGADPTVVVADPLPLVTQKVDVAAPNLGLPFDFGWLHLDLNHDGSTLLAQSYVSTSQRASGRFSIGTDAVMLGHPAVGSRSEIAGIGVPFHPQAVNLRATKTVAGTFTPGGTVTYTVTLTNQGPQAQPNNPTDEFFDNVPVALAVVSANASSGAATVAGNFVVWNGSIGANASVTITITATVNSNVSPGTVIQNQGRAVIDANADGSNETQISTDDPSRPGSVDPTAFTVPQFVNIQATKAVAGTFAINGAITYTVAITNQGPRAQPDNAGNEFTDTLPLGLTLVSASADSGTVATDIPNRLVTWNGPIAVNQRITLTIQATINADQGGRQLSNRGVAFADADQTPDGVNESQFPTNLAAFTVAPLVQVQATKTVTGQFTAGGTVIYTVTLTNQGPQAQPDNATDEFEDFMPDGLTLVSASASSGAATADVPSNRVTWNGPIAANASVTLTITATVRPGQFGIPIRNQGFAYIDRNLDGINERGREQIPTDDPGLPGTADPTTFVGQ